MTTVSPFVPMSPRITSPAHPSSGGGAGQAGAGRGGGGRGYLRDRANRELIGQTVRIIEGPYKSKVDIHPVETVLTPLLVN